MATSTDPAPAADAPDAAPSPSRPLVRQYLDETPRTYCFTGGTVVTPQRGDVCEIPYDPGDGRWGETKAKVTRLSDNDPKQAEKNAAAQAETRDKALTAAAAATAETGKAAS